MFMNDETMLKSMAIRVLVEKRLTLDEFVERARAYEVFVIRPGMITTSELRGDNSRYRPIIKDGIVVGGNFG